MDKLRHLSILTLGLVVSLSCAEPPTASDDLSAQAARGGKKASFALQFDAAQGTETPDANDLDLGPTFTFEAWVKPFNATGGIQHIVSKWGSGTDASYNFGIRSGPVQMNTRAEGANSVNVGLTTLQDNVWQHVAATFDNGEVRLYINGELDNVIPGARVPQNSATVVSLGRQKALSGFIGQQYDGIMDEVRIWSTARSQREIQKNMNKKLNLKRLPAGLIAYWQLDEGSGDIASDASGSGHDMRLGDAVGSDAADPAWVSPGKP